MKSRRRWLLGGVLVAVASCSAWALLAGSSLGDDERRRALEFLRERDLEIPIDASAVRFWVDDDFRSIGYRVRFDLPTTDATDFRARLWCTPTGTDVEQGQDLRIAKIARRFSSSPLTDAQYCDTNGPYDGHYHLTAVVGRVRTDKTRFLLAFSD